MRLRGISHDVGWVLGMNWRPVSDLDVAQETYGDVAVRFNGQSRG
jgi:hypothetical protein